MNPDFFAVTFNCTGLKTTKDQLEIFLYEIGETLGSRPQAIMLQECFLTRDELMNIKMRGYRAVVATEGQRSKSQCQRRGSVILVDMFLNVQALHERSTQGVELIGIKVIGDADKTLDNPFELWTAYSGPYSKEAKIFATMLKKLNKEKKTRVLIAGDMNSKYQALAANQVDHCKAITEQLAELEMEGNTTILNDCGVRTTNTGSTIDLAITMGEFGTGFAVPIEYDLASTHFPVCIGICTGEAKSRKFDYITIPRYKINKENEQRTKQKCVKIGNNIDNFTEDTLAQAILDIFKPEKPAKRSAKKKTRRHWWNKDKEIGVLFQKKQDHLAKFGKDNEFTEIENQLQEKISKAKNTSFQEYASSLDHTNRGTDVFRAIRMIGKPQPSRIAQLAVRGKNGKVVSDMQQKADILSVRYQVPLGHHPKRDKARIAQLKENRKEKEEANPKGIGHSPFSASEARIAREEMANNKAPGLTRIRKEDLEMGGTEMDKLMAQLADKVTLSGQYPQTLKKGVTCPIPKDSEATDIIEEDQTRPITLLEVLDKWLQKIFYNRVKKYVDFHETQAGYSLSCDHHTAMVSDFIMNREDQPYTLAVFTDIAKAFDSVPHDELIDAIWNSNIPAQIQVGHLILC